VFGFRRSTQWIAFATVIVAIGFCSTQALAGNSGNSNAGVLPSQSSPDGKTYGEWATVWWKWAFPISVPGNPLFDETGARVAQGQSGHVWFVAGRWMT
jgi:hypothetical protein